MDGPTSNRRLVPSWRRSRKWRSVTSGSTQARRNAVPTDVGLQGTTRPLPIRPSRFSATRARSTPSPGISSPWTAAAWVRIIVITPMSMPSATGPARWSARLQPYSMSLRRSRWPIFFLPRSRFRVASVAALARVGVVSLRRTDRLWEGQAGHRTCAGGPRTIGWAAALDRPGSGRGPCPFPGVVTAQGASIARTSPFRLTGRWVKHRREAWVERGHFPVRLMCASRGVETGDIRGYPGVAWRGRHSRQRIDNTRK